MHVCRDYYTPVDLTQIPNGQLLPVNGTAFDFTKPRTIGSRINEVQYLLHARLSTCITGPRLPS